MIVLQSFQLHGPMVQLTYERLAPQLFRFPTFVPVINLDSRSRLRSLQWQLLGLQLWKHSLFEDRHTLMDILIGSKCFRCSSRTEMSHFSDKGCIDFL